MDLKKINYRRLFLNKYFIITIAFALLIIFFDKYNLPSLQKMNKELKKMEKQVEEYDKQYKEDSITLERLKNDPEFLEEYAREHYFMKLPDEEVFIIEAAPEDSL